MRYLIDSNILIYFITGSAPDNVLRTIRNILVSSFYISIISRIEVLGWNKHTDESYKKTNDLLHYSTIIPVDEAVANEAIRIRQRTHTKLPDAVIAATAISLSATLVTRNYKDFISIQGLKLLNPFEYE
ncbi:MAG TPA: type II toxin-antitoxin system VapC family toxin [Methanospirillum sp.]|nr:type II toxin-antitoxin system VapC family toxin [Methanospirillum sp.]